MQQWYDFIQEPRNPNKHIGDSQALLTSWLGGDIEDNIQRPYLLVKNMVFNFRRLETGNLSVRVRPDEPMDWNRLRKEGLKCANMLRGLVYNIFDALNDFRIFRSRPERLDEDSCSASIRKAWNTGRITIELCFACQLHCEISESLGRQKNKLVDLQNGAGYAMQRLHQVLNTSATDKCWSKSTNKLCRQARIYVEQNLLRPLVPSAQDGKEDPAKMWDRHPHTCGNAMYGLRLRMTQAGKSVLFSSGSLLFTAHLYIALQQTPHFRVMWPNLEECIQALGIEEVFKGELPQNLPESYERCTSLLRTYEREMPSSNYKGEPPEAQGEQIVDSSIDTDDEPTSVTPGPLELVEQFGRQTEILCKILTIDYLEIHFLCLELLRRLREALRGTLIQFDTNYVKANNQLPLVAGYILHVAALTTYNRGMEAGEVILKQAATLVEEFIESEKLGDVYSPCPPHPGINALELKLPRYFVSAGTESVFSFSFMNGMSLTKDLP